MKTRILFASFEETYYLRYSVRQALKSSSVAALVYNRSLFLMMKRGV